MIKDLWSKIAYIWFVFMLIFVGFFASSDKVSASTKQSWATSQSRIVMDNHGSNSFTSWQNNPYTFTGLSYPVKNAQFRLRTSDGFSAENSYTFTIQYVPTPDSLGVQSLIAFKDGDLSQTENLTCLQWVRSSSGLYSSECSFQPHSNYSSSQYLWVAITFFQEYQNSVTLGVSQYEERLGVSAVITNQTNIINNSINSLDNTIKDDSVDDPDEMFEDFEDLLPENGVITSLIGLPITLYQKILNSINGTCAQFSLGSLYGTNLIMPCIDIDTYLGSTIWNTIDLIISGGFVLIIAKKMIKAFNHFSSLKEGDVIND